MSSYSIRPSSGGGGGVDPAAVAQIVTDTVGDQLPPAGGTPGQTLVRGAGSTLAWATPAAGGGATTGTVTAYDGPTRKATVSYVDDSGVTVTVGNCPNAGAFQLSVGDTVALAFRKNAAPLITGRVAVASTYTPPAFAPLNATAGYPFDQTATPATGQVLLYPVEDTGNVVGKGAGALVGLHGTSAASSVLAWTHRANGTSGQLAAAPFVIYGCLIAHGRLWVAGALVTQVAYYDPATTTWVSPTLPALGSAGGANYLGSCIDTNRFEGLRVGSDGALRFYRYDAWGGVTIHSEKWDTGTGTFVREWSSPTVSMTSSTTHRCTLRFAGGVVWVHFWTAATSVLVRSLNLNTRVWAGTAYSFSGSNTTENNNAVDTFYRSVGLPDGRLWVPSRAASSWAATAYQWCTIFDTAAGSVVSQWLPGVNVANGVQALPLGAGVGLANGQVLVPGTARDAENDGNLAVIWSTDGVTTAQVWTGQVSGRNLFPTSTAFSPTPTPLRQTDPGRFIFTVTGSGAPIVYDVTL